MRFALVGACATEATIALLAAALGLFAGGEHSAKLFLFGLVNLFAAAMCLRFIGSDRRFHRRDAMATVTLQWLLMVLLGAIPYLITRTLPNVLDALYDSTAGFTTTSSTTIADVEVLSDSMQFWRAGTQWMGALNALVFFVVISPRVGHVAASAGPDSVSRQGRELSRTPYGAMARIAAALAVLTVSLAVAYLVAGMNLRDAVFHGLTTSSTGGFSTRNASLASYRSPAIEWVAILGMAAAGASVVHVIRLVRGSVRSIWRSTELRVYLGLLSGGAAVGWLANDNEGARSATFAAASAVSTTGLRASELAEWQPASLVVLFVLMTVGSMGGSPGGGLRVLSVATLVAALNIELRKIIYPRLVSITKLGRSTIPPETVDRISAQIFLSTVVLIVALLFVTGFGAGMLDGLSAVLSAFANAGPVVGTLDGGSEQARTVSSFDTALVFDRVSRVVLLCTMFLGRLAVHPVLVTVGMASHETRVGLRRLRRFHPWRIR